MTDKQYLLTLTVCLCCFFGQQHSTYYVSDFLLQLCLFRSSLQRFLETSSTINLAFVIDGVLGYHDGNFQRL